MIPKPVVEPSVEPFKESFYYYYVDTWTLGVPQP